MNVIRCDICQADVTGDRATRGRGVDLGFGDTLAVKDASGLRLRLAVDEIQGHREGHVCLQCLSEATPWADGLTLSRSNRSLSRGGEA